MTNDQWPCIFLSPIFLLQLNPNHSPTHHSLHDACISTSFSERLILILSPVAAMVCVQFTRDALMQVMHLKQLRLKPLVPLSPAPIPCRLHKMAVSRIHFLHQQISCQLYTGRYWPWKNACFLIRENRCFIRGSLPPLVALHTGKSLFSRQAFSPERQSGKSHGISRMKHG